MRGLRPCLIMDNGHSIEEVEGIMFIGGQDIISEEGAEVGPPTCKIGLFQDPLGTNYAQ